MNMIKKIMCETFEKWEMWMYFVIIPLGLVASATVGYLLGFIYQ